MKFLNKINIPFLKLMSIASIISIVLFILSVGFISYKIATDSFNLGIDFAGGIEIKVKVEQDDEIAIDEIREVYKNFDENVNIQESTGIDNKNVFILRMRSVGTDINEKTALTVDKLNEKYSNVLVLSNSAISGVVSSDNIKLAAILIIVSWALILLYITIRFDINYAVPAILSLIHNIVITFAILLFLGNELTILTLSALLTLIGYSINDTIVVYDRIRENMNIESAKPLKEIVNISLKQIFSRTVMTSVSTLLAAGAILIWGGDILFDFALTFFIGVCIGTYASNLIATSLLIKFIKIRTKKVEGSHHNKTPQKV